MGRGLHDAKAPIRTHPAGVNEAGRRAAAGRDPGRAPVLEPDAGHSARPPPRLQRLCASLWRAPRMARASQSAANAWPASLGHPRGGGRGFSPIWVRIFSIAARSRITVMIFSSPALQVGVEHSLEQPRPLMWPNLKADGILWRTGEAERWQTARASDPRRNGHADSDRRSDAARGA
jgi:hypothetical protein